MIARNESFMCIARRLGIGKEGVQESGTGKVEIEPSIKNNPEQKHTHMMGTRATRQVQEIVRNTWSPAAHEIMDRTLFSTPWRTGHRDHDYLWPGLAQHGRSTAHHSDNCCECLFLEVYARPNGWEIIYAPLKYFVHMGKLMRGLDEFSIYWKSLPIPRSERYEHN